MSIAVPAVQKKRHGLVSPARAMPEKDFRIIGRASEEMGLTRSSCLEVAFKSISVLDGA
jgi:hypothetical protein